MTDSRTNQMIRREVMDALKKVSFDIQKAEFRSYPSIQAKTVLNKIKMESQKFGRLNQSQVEALVDGAVADLSYWHAFGSITFDIQVGRRPNQKDIREAQDAISVLQRVGREDTARIYVEQLANKIGTR